MLPSSPRLVVKPSAPTEGDDLEACWGDGQQAPRSESRAALRRGGQNRTNLVSFHLFNDKPLATVHGCPTLSKQ